MNHNKKRQNPIAAPLKPVKPAKHSQASHQVRIIGGDWKRTPLTVIYAEGLRPTPDRVRETVFNWLNHVFNGQWQLLSCLDVFAGSGALGFEAASRGAAKVRMFEAFPAAFAQLEQLKQKLKADQITLQRGDALILLKSLTAKAEKYEVIFLDPPFNLGFLEKVLPLCVDLLAPNGVVYVESEQAYENLDAVATAGWQILRQDKAGSVHFHLLQRNTDSGEAA
jgi:16S rRNA (guanine(966)-N(2))-methyltransferase RsmD